MSISNIGINAPIEAPIAAPLERECEYCDHQANITEPSGIRVCIECHADCPHTDIECGECQDCGEHISNFMDEDYGGDR